MGEVRVQKCHSRNWMSMLSIKILKKEQHIFFLVPEDMAKLGKLPSQRLKVEKQHFLKCVWKMSKVNLEMLLRH